MVDERAKRIIAEGSIRIKVKRTGMYQFQIFKVKRVRLGADQFVELFLDRVLDRSEIQRLANELGLPVEAENGRALPDGMGEKDFINL
jgi:hypothetical protein